MVRREGRGFVSLPAGPEETLKGYKDPSTSYRGGMVESLHYSHPNLRLRFGRYADARDLVRGKQNSLERVFRLPGMGHVCIVRKFEPRGKRSDYHSSAGEKRV